MSERAQSVNHNDLWRSHAACLDADPALWYPDAGTALAARLICATCPVRQDCLQHALVDGETYGVWGGASERVRRYLRRLLHASPHPERTWRQKGCTCGYCQALDDHDHRMSDLAAGRATPRFDSRGPNVRHGTPSCYPKGCRRPECLAALREWRAERRRKLREEGEAS